MRQYAPLFGVSKSAADRIIDHLGPMLALQPRKRFAKDTVLIVDGTTDPGPHSGRAVQELSVLDQPPDTSRCYAVKWLGVAFSNNSRLADSIAA